MKKIATVILPVFIIGCAGDALVEVGFHDGTLFDAQYGDITMCVTRIELPEEDAYVTIWEGAKDVAVAIQTEDYVSITDNYISISPGSYLSLRLTVNDVHYVHNTIDETLVDTSYQFVANAFSQIVIEENDEFRFAVIINSAAWFDVNTGQIRDGHEAFEDAKLRLHYE